MPTLYIKIAEIVLCKANLANVRDKQYSMSGSPYLPFLSFLAVSCKTVYCPLLWFISSLSSYFSSQVWPLLKQNLPESINSRRVQSRDATLKYQTICFVFKLYWLKRLSIKVFSSLNIRLWLNQLGSFKYKISIC